VPKTIQSEEALAEMQGLFAKLQQYDKLIDNHQYEKLHQAFRRYMDCSGNSLADWEDGRRLGCPLRVRTSCEVSLRLIPRDRM